MSRWRRALIATTCWIGASAAGAAGVPQAPAFEIDRGVLTITAFPEVLSRKEVRPHLGSGLTTSFVVEIEARDTRGRLVRGAGRIDVRYELWDEVYLVRTFGAAGVRRLPPMRSFEELQGAWQRLRLPVAMAGALDRAAGPWELEVALSVVPFSQSEQRDAQRWFNDSIAARPPSVPAPPGPRSSENVASETGGVLDLFLGSSIQRRSLVRYDWVVEFRPEATR